MILFGLPGVPGAPLLPLFMLAELSSPAASPSSLCLGPGVLVRGLATIVSRTSGFDQYLEIKAVSWPAGA